MCLRSIPPLKTSEIPCKYWFKSGEIAAAAAAKLKSRALEFAFK